MASGTKNKGVRAARASVVAKKPTPWGTIAAVLVIVLLAGGVFGYAYVKNQDKKDREAAAAKWRPGKANQDPSKAIDGIVIKDYKGAQHVDRDEKVAYDLTPPAGGPHDYVWADCTGVVYKAPVRSENLVHALEHGAIWIAYNADKVNGAALDKLKEKVTGQPKMILSPYPNLDKPISLQAWGHQLKLDNASDERIDHFVASLRQNQYVAPEYSSSCDPAPNADPSKGFDTANPPPFVADPGPNAVKMDGSNSKAAKAAASSAPPPPASGSSAPPPSK